MTLAESIAHIQSQLEKARMGCFVPVSPTALSVVLAAIEVQQGEPNDGDAHAQR